jgi:hypothetical protein
VLVCVDVDDVCFDFPAAYAAWLAEHSRPTFDPAFPHHYKFPELLGLTRAQYHDDALAVLYASVDQPPLPGCREALGTLSRLGFTLVLVSARPPEQLPATRAWAARWDLPVRDVRCIGARGSKGEVCAALGALAHVDDNPQHLRDVARFPVAPVAFGAYHWSAPGPWRHARTWRDVPTVLAALTDRPVR